MFSTDLSAGRLAPSHMTLSDMAPSSSVADKTASTRSFSSALQAFFSLQRESAAMRFIARGVLATWLLPVLFALFATFATPLGAPVALAQGAPTQGAPAQSVIVLDFATAAGVDPLIGRKAADGLAVELQRSGSFDVVPRLRVEEAVNQQAGLQPPYNNIAQIKLAETVNASSVFSGRITGVEITPGRMARVSLEVNQLDVITGDNINGTVVSESTEQKLGQVASEILVDEAINKAVFAAVRSLRQTTLPTGTVLNVATDEVVLSIGADAGVSTGERFTVLRDKYDRARNVTERSKIGELTITDVNATQSSARISAGGQEGVRTGDRVRQIFTASNYPTTTLRNGNSTTPVTAPPRRANGSGAGGLLKKSQAGILGLVGLAALVGLVGFGGGSGNNPPRGVDITEANPTQTYPQPRFTFSAGFNGINFSQTLDRESVVAYIIYRGTAANFTPDVNNIQAVVDARFDASNKNITFTDPGVQGVSRFRRVVITSTVTGGGTTGTTGNVSGTSNINVTFTDLLTTDAIANILDTTSNQITIQFTQNPLQIGQTYYYRVGRVTAERQRTTVTDGTTTTNTTQVTLLPVRSPISSSIGGYTPLFLPQIVPNQQFNTDNFSVQINTDITAFAQGNVLVDANGNTIGVGNTGTTFGYDVPNNFYVGSGVNQFRFEVSTSQAFPRNATFVSPDIPNPGFNTNGFLNQAITLSLGNSGDIRIPSSATNPYVPGSTPLFLRVLSRNTNDSDPTFRVSPTLRIDSAQGQDRTASNRFLPAPSGGADQGFNLNRGGGIGARTGAGTRSPRVGRPQ